MTKPEPIPYYISFIISVINSCQTLAQLNNTKSWAYNFCSKNSKYADYKQMINEECILRKKEVIHNETINTI